MKKRKIESEDPVKKISVISFCAHNDDQIVGAGGTLAKYAIEGKRFATFIFSHGEMSHPWMKPKEVIKFRTKEAMSSEKVLGGSGIIFAGAPEGKFKDELYIGDLKYRIQRLVKSIKPEKIFTHSLDDPHPDHRAVFSIVRDALKEIKYKGEVYSFEVWNPINLKKRNNPKMVVDISDTFSKKIKSFRKHKSQKTAIISLLWKVYLQDFFNGFKNHCRFAEVFYKVDLYEGE